jgi:hypothetical protein
MKNILLSFFILLTSFFVNSQVSSYTFGTSTGTYTPITGGANYDNFTSWSNTNFLDDNNSTVLESIGFNFVYNGTTYTQFAVNTNGFITLGALPTNSYLPLSTGTSNNVISAMGADLIGRGSLLANRTSGSATITITGGDISQILVGDKVSGTGIPAGSTVLSKTATTVTISANASSTGTGFHFRFSRSTFGIRFQTIGTAPNRTLVVQWTGWQRYTTSGAFGELYNFQIRLNETTNTIDIVYNIQGPTSATATTFQIGLRGSANTNFNNRTTTTNWSSTTAGTLNSSTVTLSSTVKPSSGLTYTWTPPSCVAPSSLLVTYTSPTSANLSWAASPSLPTNGYEWEIRTSGLGGSGATGLTASGSVGAGVTSASTSSLTQNTTYILYVRSNCGGTYSSWNASASSTSPSPPPANDYCSGSVTVSCGTSSLAGTTVGTIVETAPFSLSSNYGVWYTFAGDGQQTTITSTATFDHSLLFMSGSCSGLSYITNIDNSFTTETYTFTTTVGVQYYIYIAHYLTSSTSTGTFTISRTCTAPPTPPINDNPSGAITLTISNTITYVTYTNVNATNTTTESTPSCALYTGEDVWFKVTLPQYVTSLDFDTQIGGITDAGMAIYRGTLGSLVEIQCDDDSSPNGAMSFISRTDFFEYETIYIRIWEYGGGTTGTFGISVTTPQPLPVELSYFEGDEYPTYNLIKWSTESENNSSHFDLESSNDGISWKVITTTPSAGNSNEEIRYSYIDNNLNKIVYYRLQQYDIDGEYETFGPIVITRNVSDKKIVRYVNLMGQEINPKNTTGIVIEIYDDGTMKKIIR